VATALLDPPKTQDELLERAQQLKEDVDEGLAYEDIAQGLAHEEPADDAERDEPVQARDAWFAQLKDLIKSVTRSEIWQAHDLARELLITRDDLAEAIEADHDATDPEWRQRAALMRMKVVVEAMLRQLEHHAIDRPEHAAEFVATRLAEVGDAEIAQLLGTTPRMVGKYRTEGVKEIRKDPNRVTLIGQLVYELQNARTPRGVALWFEAPREALGEQTPLALIEQDVARARETLIPLARGGRGQLDRAGRGAVE
jgi:hypothetical protein